MNNKNNSWLITRFWITNHLGRNPKKGGNPPRDNKFKNRKNFIFFEIKYIENNWFKWEILNILKKNKILNLNKE